MRFEGDFEYVLTDSAEILRLVKKRKDTTDGEPAVNIFPQIQTLISPTEAAEYFRLPLLGEKVQDCISRALKEAHEWTIEMFEGSISYFPAFGEAPYLGKICTNAKNVTDMKSNDLGNADWSWCVSAKGTAWHNDEHRETACPQFDDVGSKITFTFDLDDKQETLSVAVNGGDQNKVFSGLRSYLGVKGRFIPAVSYNARVKATTKFRRK